MNNTMILLAVVWVCCTAVSIATKQVEVPLGMAVVVTILVGFGYLCLHAI